jgi:hypothetical protein
MKYFSVSFLWGLFKWFFSGKEQCGGGFEQFPTFGLKALKQTYVFVLLFASLRRGFELDSTIYFSFQLNILYINSLEKFEVTRSVKILLLLLLF